MATQNSCIQCEPKFISNMTCGGVMFYILKQLKVMRNITLSKYKISRWNPLFRDRHSLQLILEKSYHPPPGHPSLPFKEKAETKILKASCTSSTKSNIKSPSSTVVTDEDEEFRSHDFTSHEWGLSSPIASGVVTAMRQLIAARRGRRYQFLYLHES